MECAFVFLTLLAATALMLFAAVGQRNSDWRRVNEALRGVAMTRDGRYLRGGWMQSPKAFFPWRQDWAVVGVQRKTRRWEVQVRLGLPDRRLACEILTDRGSASERSRAYGFLQTPTGPLYVWSNDLAMARQLLSDGVRLQLDRLRAAGDLRDAKMVVEGGRLAIVKPLRRVTGESVHEAVALALELYEQSLVALLVGIDFQRPAASLSLDEAICQVCGEELSGEVVLCRICKTPHHHDCWTFIGACSVFGCGCDECEIGPRAARAPKPWRPARQRR